MLCLEVRNFSYVYFPECNMFFPLWLFEIFSFFPCLTMCLVLFAFYISYVGFAALLESVYCFLQKILSNYVLKYFFYPIFSPLSFWGSSYMNVRTFYVVSHVSYALFLLSVFYYLYFSLDNFIDLSLRLMILSLALFISADKPIQWILFFFLGGGEYCTVRHVGS